MDQQHLISQALVPPMAGVINHQYGRCLGCNKDV